jgi:glycosyltransferase involved in cell wall biosynthesis
VNGVSLVMATLGRVDEIRRGVDALLKQTSRRFELIVVDQNPDDRLVPVLERARIAGMAVLHVRQAEPNQCLARNAGLALARMDLVAFPDDDCWYEPETIERVVDRMSAEDAPDGLLVRWIEQDPRGAPEHVLDWRKWRSFREVHASAITQFFRRELIQSIGGFDPDLGLHSWFGGGEETDLMFRVLASGAVIRYSPMPLVHHPVHHRLIAPDWRSACRKSRSRSRGTGALYAKHRLSGLVILRGFVSPLLRPLWRRQGWATVAQGIFTTLGRIEGFWRWRWRQRTPTTS